MAQVRDTRPEMKADGDPALKASVQDQDISFHTDAVPFTDRCSSVLDGFGRSTWRLPIESRDESSRV